MKKCNRCGIEKDVSLFSVRKRTGKPFSECKSCSAERQRAAYKSNPEYREARKAWSKTNSANQDHRKPWNRHHISEEHFNNLYSKFDGKCHVCRVADAKVVDHNHACCQGVYSCGQCVRGLLCGQCNTALGLLLDKRQTLVYAIEYLDA